MKQITYIFACIFTLVSISCSKTEDNSAEVSFSPTSTTVDAGKLHKLPLMVRTKGGSWEAYEYKSHRYDILLSSSNEKVVSVTDSGYVQALTPGYATITAQLNDSKAKFSILVNESGFDLDFDYSKSLTPDMIYSNETILSNNTAMQSFDILKNGDIITGGSKNAACYFQQKKPNQPAGEPMTIWYSGHCSNFSVEENKGEVYLWISNFSGKNSENNYYREQIISRVRFVPGASLIPEDCPEHFYMGSNNGSSSCAAIDTEHNLIAIYSNSRIKVYDLEEARNAIVKDVQLAEIRRGGEAGSPRPVEEVINPIIKAHDLTSIAPKGTFAVDLGKVNGTNSFGEGRAFQGMCIYKDKIYWLSGSSNPDASVTIFSLSGKIEKLCQQFSFENEVQDLIDAGVTETGYFEPEGIKIRYGKLYLGFIWKHQEGSQWTWRSSIIKYN